MCHHRLHDDRIDKGFVYQDNENWYPVIMCGHAGIGDVVLMIGMMDGSYVLIGYGIFISSLSCIAGCMHCGGVRFRCALPVMIPWFVGLLGLFGVVRIFRDDGNRFSSIAIMPVDTGMAQCIICLVNEPMSASARGIMFGNASAGISIFFQVSMLFSIIIIGYLVFKIAGLCVRGVRFMLGEPVS